MRRTILTALVLSGCCFTPTATPGPTTSTTGSAPATAPAASGPGAPGCPDLATSIVGTWSHEGVLEEYRADGTTSIGGGAGTYRWSTPGHATLVETSTGRTADYDMGLVDAMTMIAINPGNAAFVYTRTTPPPAIPANCFDLGAVFARTWHPRTGGGPDETYSTDGTYRAPGTGRWSFSLPGHLDLVRDGDGMATDYLVAMPSATTMLAVRAGTGVAYDAVP